MSTYSELNITVRRKDRMPVTDEDLRKFEEFYYDRDCLYATEFHSDPHICTNGMEMFANCQIKHTLEPDPVLRFSKDNPHLQIELMEFCEDEDVGDSRYLFEGAVWELLSQNREFEEPKTIDWPIGHIHMPEEHKKLADCVNEPGFFQFLGENIRNSYQDDCEPDDSFAEMVTSAYLSDSVEALFLALVGWSLTDLIERWNEFKNDMFEDTKVAQAARKILEEGLF